MYNDKEKISASEINKFSFCQYSWYYQRLYGPKAIKQKPKQTAKRSSKQKSTQSHKIDKNLNKTLNNFQRGIIFHDTYLLKRRRIAIARVISLLIFIAITILIYSRL